MERWSFRVQSEICECKLLRVGTCQLHCQKCWPLRSRQPGNRDCMAKLAPYTPHTLRSPNIFIPTLFMMRLNPHTAHVDPANFEPRSMNPSKVYLLKKSKRLAHGKPLERWLQDYDTLASDRSEAARSACAQKLSACHGMPRWPKLQQNV